MTWLQGAVHTRTLLTFFRASRVSRLWRSALRRAAQACHVSRQQPSLQVRWCTCAVLTACQATRQACCWRQPCKAGESRRLPEGCGTEVWEPSALTRLQDGPRQSKLLEACAARPVSESVQLPYEKSHVSMPDFLVEASCRALLLLTAASHSLPSLHAVLQCLLHVQAADTCTGRRPDSLVLSLAAACPTQHLSPCSVCACPKDLSSALTDCCSSVY